MLAKPVAAAVYCRLSLAAMGDTTNVDDQARICRELAAVRGWQVTPGHVYTDNSRSAWQRNRKRPGWDAMLRAVEAGEIGAIVVYHGDRLARQPFDLEKLLNLAEGKGIRLASPGGDRDLSNGDDLFILRIEVAAACRESWSTSRRVRAQLDRREARGMVRTGGRGGRAFAFGTDGVSIIAEEAEALRTVASMLLDDMSSMSACRWLAASGITGTAGEPFTHYTLRQVLMNPRYAGLMPDGETRAAWKPVLGTVEWEAVRALLAARSRPGPQPRYLLSGIALCGSCGQPLWAWKGSKGKHVYKCVRGEPCPRRVSRSQPLADAYVSGRVVALLSGPAFLKAIRKPADPGLAAEITALETRRDQVRRQLEDLAGHPEISPALAASSLESFARRITELRARAAASGRQRLIASRAGITREQWERLGLDEKRALIAACYKITVLPAQRGRRGFDTSLIKLERIGD